MEGISERLRKLRRELDLTQAEFGRRVGLKQNTVALIETGRSTSEQTILAICKEFHVSRDWLVDGLGEMFVPAPTTALEKLAQERGLDRSVVVMVEKFLDLPADIQDGIIKYVQDVAAAIEAEQDEIERKVEQYRQQLIEEKKTRDGSSASSEPAGNGNTA